MQPKLQSDRDNWDFLPFPWAQNVLEFSAMLRSTRSCLGCLKSHCCESILSYYTWCAWYLYEIGGQTVQYIIIFSCHCFISFAKYILQNQKTATTCVGLQHNDAYNHLRYSMPLVLSNISLFPWLSSWPPWGRLWV